MEKSGYTCVHRFKMRDCYYTRLDTSRGEVSYRELMKNSFVVRGFNDDYGDRITYKHKKFDARGNVVAEDKVDCPVGCVKDANRIFMLAGLNKWVEKRAEAFIYKKAGMPEVCFQLVAAAGEGGVFIEIEQTADMRGTANEVIAQLIEYARGLGLPLGEDFHVRLPYLLYQKKLLSV